MDDEIASGLPAPAETEAVQKPVDVVVPGTAPETTEEVKQAEPEKTFTQAELDAAIQKRLLKEARRVHRHVEQQYREQAEASAREVAPKRDAFGDDEAYLNAQIDHLAEKKAAEKFEQRTNATKAEKAQEAFAEKAEGAKSRYADFDAVVSNPALAINAGMVEFISDSDAGPDLAYFLGKNPEKAAEIAALSPIKAARELTRIEAELAHKPTPKTSSAPAPITPVGTRGSAPPSIANADFSEYKKLRVSQGAPWSR